MTDEKLLRTHTDLLAGLDLAIEQASDPALLAASAPAVSKWSVKDHLEHLSIADAGIVAWIGRARDGDPELETDGGPNLLGRIVLLTGAFPRGRGKAPERTVPQGVSAAELAARIRRTRAEVDALGDSLPRIRAATATRNHFAFGDLNAVQWLQFVVIHHRHHQKIIRDVLRAR